MQVVTPVPSSGVGLTDALEPMTDAVVIIDARQIVTYCNATAERLWTDINETNLYENILPTRPRPPHEALLDLRRIDGNRAGYGYPVGHVSPIDASDPRR